MIALTDAEAAWLRENARGDLAVEVVLARHADGRATRLDLACADILRRHVLPPHVGLRPVPIVEPRPRQLGPGARNPTRVKRAMCSTKKRSYGSPEAARRAMATASNRVRAYLCPECSTWHITDEEKR